MRQDIEHQNKVRADLEIMYSGRVSTVEKQAEISNAKAVSLEKHLALIRRREKAAIDDSVKAKNALNQQKLSFEEKINNLQKSNYELEEEFRTIRNQLERDMNEKNRQIRDLESVSFEFTFI